MLTVGTVTGNIIVTDVRTNKIVKTLPCGPGCHGINFGAKKGGGYYGYVTVKFANKMVVVDVDPDGTGDLSKAKVAGEVVVDPEPDTQMDDTPTKYIGEGGNGVEIYPPVYNGWVQKLPDAEKAKLTCKQRPDTPPPTTRMSRCPCRSWSPGSTSSPGFSSAPTAM